MEHPYGWWSVLPPVAAILLAVLTRKAFLSLIASIALGACLTANGDLVTATYDLFEVHLWPALTDPGKLRVFSFTLLMGALVGVLTSSGAMRSLVQSLTRWAGTRQRGQLVTWGLGVAIFFDDYANTMLLGGTLRPLCDRLRISREKLAFLVDSTAAPIAGLSLLSTWVAVELSYLQEGIDAVGADSGLTPVEVFVSTIPYRFYVLGTLAFVFLIAWTGRDFGPMWTAEQRRLDDTDEEDTDEEPTETPNRWSALVATLPIFVTILIVMALMYSTGYHALQEPGATGPDAVTIQLRDIVGAADSSLALQYGSLVGLLLAIGLTTSTGQLTWREAWTAAGRGAQVVLPAIGILWAAAALSRMTGQTSLDGRSSVDTAGVQTYEFADHRLYTADFLTQEVIGREESSGESVSRTLRLLPTIVFLLAAAVSFSTGTSFGTMGMLTPMTLSLTYALLVARGSPVSPADPFLLATVGSVLAGAIFGDHCSPISDTTILSAEACRCDLIAHTVTQLPYAMTVGTISIVCGTLPIGWGVPVPLLLLFQACSLWLVIRLFGRVPQGSEPDGNAPSDSSDQ